MRSLGTSKAITSCTNVSCASWRRLPCSSNPSRHGHCHRTAAPSSAARIGGASLSLSLSRQQGLLSRRRVTKPWDSHRGAHISTVCASGGGADGAPEGGNSGGGPNSRIALTIAAAGVAGGLLLPAAALATPTDDVHSMYLLSVGLGAAFTLITLLSTSRFIMSYFPRLVRKAGRGRTLWRVFTVFDPVLQPVQTRLFRMEPGDLDYSAMLLLAVVCAMLEGLVGDGGLLVEKVPDLQLLGYLQALVAFQHGLLLPSWAMVVGRFFAFL